MELVSEAIILVAGRGTRLGELTSEVPKPLLPVNDVPFLSYQIHWLRERGIERIILHAGYLAEQFQAYARALGLPGLEVVVEPESLGTGGGIAYSQAYVRGDDYLALNGDTFFDYDLVRHYNCFAEHRPAITIALREIESTARYGRIITDPETGSISSFLEKDEQADGPGLINGGFYFINKRTFSELAPTGAFSIERDLFPRASQAGLLYGEQARGPFIDIGTPQDYERAKSFFKGKYESL